MVTVMSQMAVVSPPLHQSCCTGTALSNALGDMGRTWLTGFMTSVHKHGLGQVVEFTPFS
jgi:hypothetical protein